MGKPNYSFEKRQRDLAKKRKKEAKRLKKLADRAGKTEGESTPSTEEEKTGS